jgi:hypothetical protein
MNILGIDIGGTGIKGAVVGCGFPAAVRDGMALTAANISKRWIGCNVLRKWTSGPAKTTPARFGCAPLERASGQPCAAMVSWFPIPNSATSKSGGKRRSGGVSKKHDKFLPLLELSSDVVSAQMRNEAGIIGAALAAMHAQPKVKRQRKASATVPPISIK